MSDDKKQPFKLVKMPSFTRLLFGGVLAYWLSTTMNPAFGAIALLVILLIPILTVDNIFSQQFSKAYRQPEQITPKSMSKTEYIEAKAAAAAKQESEDDKQASKKEAKKSK